MEEFIRASERPSVVPRRDIPPSQVPTDKDVEVRPFTAHQLLSRAVPDSVDLNWIYVPQSQEIAPRSHSEPGMLIVLQGRARLVSSQGRFVEEGDVVTLPGGHEYGFTDVGAAGLLALHVAFQATSAVGKAEVASLEELLARNEERCRAALESPFFKLLEKGQLNSASKRALLQDGLRIFSDAFQAILFTRQATCRDEEYSSVFLEHFLEEQGHNTLLKVPSKRRGTLDPVLKATSSWFAHQMLVLDNAGKAVVHLALETAGYQFHMLAKPVFERSDAASYFDTHAEDDEHHQTCCVDLLRGHHPSTYQSLAVVLDDTWDMFDAMTRRIAHLVCSADADA